MILDSLYIGECPIVAVYKGLDLVYVKGKAFLRANVTLADVDSDATILSLKSEPMAAESYIPETIGEGNLVTNPSVAMEQIAVEEIIVEGYADIYIKNTATFIADEQVVVETDAAVQAATAVAMARDELVTIDTVSEMNVPTSASMTRDEEISIGNSAELNAPEASSISADSDVATIETECDIATGSPAPLGADNDICIVVEAELSVVSSSALAAESDAITFGSEADFEREITKYYTANFYDGEKLMSSQQLAHGETATPPDHNKDGYLFLGWEPENMVITEDTNFYGSWEELPPEDIVPEQILTELKLDSLYKVYVQNVDITTDRLVAGNTYIVEWNDVAYTCYCRDVAYALTSQYVPNMSLENGIGNAKMIKNFGDSITASTTDTYSNDAPFLINNTDGGSSIAIRSQTADPVKVRVYAYEPQATEFLPSTTFTNEYNEDFGAFTSFAMIDKATFDAWNSNSEPVIVVYDDTEYTCEVQEVIGYAAVGNLEGFGGTSNGEKFAVAALDDVMDGETVYYFIWLSTVDTEPTEHTIRIYQK